MTELEKKLVEKILERIDMDKLTDLIAEKAAELIIQKEYPSSPVIPPITPNKMPWIEPFKPIEPIVVMYGVTTTDYEIKTAVTEQHSDSASIIQNDEKYEKD